MDAYLMARQNDVEEVREEEPYSWRDGVAHYADAWIDGLSEVDKLQVHTKFDPHLMLYLVGEDLELAIGTGDDGSTSAGAGAAGRSMVCRTLPEEVVEEVLVRLPGAAQARFRAVCKAWLAMLSDLEFGRRSFLHSLSQTSPPPMCAARFWPEEYYFPAWENLRRISPLFKTMKVDLSFLPKLFHSTEKVELHNCSPSGFMCITRRVRQGMHVCVLNPVNQSFKVLPMLDKVWGYEIVLVMGTVTAPESIPSFRLHVLQLEPVPNSGLDPETPLFEDVATYNSISGDWKGFFYYLGWAEVASPPVAVARNGDVYTTVAEDGDPPRLVRFSKEMDQWDLDLALPCDLKKDLPWPSRFHLAMHRRRLLCCGSGIWMLHDARQLWVKIAGRCPPRILPPPNPDTHYLHLDKVHVAGDLLVFFYKFSFHRHNQNSDRPHPRSWNWPVAYHMLGRSWRKLPQTIAQVWDVFQPMPNLRL